VRKSERGVEEKKLVRIRLGHCSGRGGKNHLRRTFLKSTHRMERNGGGLTTSGDEEGKGLPIKLLKSIPQRDQGGHASRTWDRAVRGDGGKGREIECIRIRITTRLTQLLGESM